jgi:hydrogenase nickel incorporation protein HypA/HybF
MHEITIAEGLLNRAIDAAEENDADTIEEITVAIGEATHINATQVEFWLEELSSDTPAEGMVVRMRKVPASGRCSCGWSGELPGLDSAIGAAPDRRCPECGNTTELTAGGECRLESVTVPDESDTQ